MKPRRNVSSATAMSNNPEMGWGDRKHRWELMTGWADDVIDEDAEDEDGAMRTGDGDVLGDHVDVTRRIRSADAIKVPAQEWEVDPDGYKPGSVRFGLF